MATQAEIARGWELRKRMDPARGFNQFLLELEGAAAPTPATPADDAEHGAERKRSRRSRRGSTGDSSA